MEDELLDNLEPNQEEQPVALEQETVEESNEESAEELKERLTKAEELAKNQRIRAEKAEKLAKSLKSQSNQPKVEETTPKNVSDSMSLKDIRALQDVHDDDIDDITEWAKFKGISIAEAKKTPHIQTLLKVKAEERNVASATNTGGQRRGTNKVSDEQVLESVFKGNISNKDEDIERFVQARMAQKRASIRRN